MGVTFEALGVSMFGSCVFKLELGLSGEKLTKQQA